MPQVNRQTLGPNTQAEGIQTIPALEVCVENFKSAMVAYKGGASRLELCSALSLDGLTPSMGLLRVLKESMPDCPIFVMIRPKPDESHIYDEEELRVMVKDIEIFKEYGANGFVFGCLDKQKRVDESACKALLDAAGTRPSTFHRAFDIVENPEKALESIVRLGFARILTSGQETNAYLGRHLIKKLVSRAESSGWKLKIVPGGGINQDNLEEILKTGVTEYHSSCRHKFHLSNRIYRTDEGVVEKMVKLGKRFIARKNTTLVMK